MAPMVPVIKKLVQNDNKVTVIVDKQPFNDVYVSEWLDKLNIVPQEMNLIEKGKLSPEAKVAIKSIIGYNNISLIHIAGADILTYDVISSIAIGDLISYENEKSSTREGRKDRYTFAGASYFKRMQELGLYTIDTAEIEDRIKKLNLDNIFEQKLV